MRLAVHPCFALHNGSTRVVWFLMEPMGLHQLVGGSAALRCVLCFSQKEFVFNNYKVAYFLLTECLHLIESKLKEGLNVHETNESIVGVFQNLLQRQQ